MRRIPALGLMLCLAATTALPAEGRDVLLALPQAARVGAGLVAMGLSVASFGEQDPLVSATALALSAAATLPAGLVLWSAAAKDGAGTRLWRRIAFWVDAGLAAGALGLGLYELLSPANSNDQRLGGSLLVVLSVPLGAGAFIDSQAYSFEKP